MEATIIMEIKLKIVESFCHMVKFAVIKAMSVMSIAVLLLIIGLSPLYVTMGMMTRQMIEKKL